MQRLSLDKAAPGLFANPKGAYVRYTEVEEMERQLRLAKNHLTAVLKLVEFFVNMSDEEANAKAEEHDIVQAARETVDDARKFVGLSEMGR